MFLDESKLTTPLYYVISKSHISIEIEGKRNEIKKTSIDI